VQLQPGDSVFFFTDGLTDARNIQEEEFSLESLTEVCARHQCASSEEWMGEIFAAVDHFAGSRPQYDDMTAAVLRLHA